MELINQIKNSIQSITGDRVPHKRDKIYNFENKVDPEEKRDHE